MKSASSVWLILIGCLLFMKCETKEGQSKNLTDSLWIKYAKGFTIKKLSNGNKSVEVGYPYQGARSGYKYLLVQRQSNSET